MHYSQGIIPFFMSALLAVSGTPDPRISACQSFSLCDPNAIGMHEDQYHMQTLAIRKYPALLALFQLSTSNSHSRSGHLISHILYSERIDRLA